MDKNYLRENKLSVLVPISDRHDNLEELFIKHREILEPIFPSHEFIFILDGDFPEARKSIQNLIRKYPGLTKLITFNKAHGEAKALSVAFAESTGDLILTLPAYFQIYPEEIIKLFDEFNPDLDILVGSRYPRRDNVLNRFQAKIFHGLISQLTGECLQDISCGVKLLRREVLEKVKLYGDMHRFFPLLAIYKGFRIKEIPLHQAPEDIHLRIYGPGVYLRRLLDILNLFFLFKFTQKPLRFFGLLGGGIGAIGLVITLITVFQRIIVNIALADRPLFLGGILFVLVGMQTFFIGLVAEIIIFTHMPEEPYYNIEEIVE